MRQNEIELARKKQQEEFYGKGFTEPADTMNITNSVFENMNERNDDE